MKRLGSTLIAAGVMGFGVLTGTPRPANACGGFFCSQVPIDQAGEQIIFSLHGDRVTATIQITYAGEAKDFAWVVPVSAKPEITLGAQAVFDALRVRTQPSFRVDWKGEGGYCGAVFAPEAAAGGPSRGTLDDGVNVVASKEVGPFQTVTLESTDGKALFKWLDDNGFDQPPESLPLIEHYVQQKMLFVALRLKQNATAGDIQPIVLDMPNPDACVPLILTRIAAQPDMPVLVYVLGNGRAVPENWFHVVVDQAKINWLSSGSNYNKLVTEAINEAAGHGFVTEFAGDSKILKDAVWRPDRYDADKLLTITDPAVLVQTLLQMGYPSDTTMRGLLRKYIPMPTAVAERGVTDQMFYNDLNGYAADLAAVGYTLNIKAFVAEVKERVLAPLQKAQEMFDGQPYLTRLLSTVSPDEMTRDPLFVLNNELSPVSNVHIAKAYGQCRNDGTVSNLQLELEDGQIIALPGISRFYGNPVEWTFAKEAPAAKRIELVGKHGQPLVIKRTQIAAVDRALNASPPEVVRMMPAVGEEPTDAGKTTGGGGCAVAAGSAAAGAGWVSGLLGLLAFGLRRRRGR